MYNALAALTAARVLGAGEDAIHAGLAGAVVCGRVEPVPLDAPFTVVIDYAHNEAAAECLLRTLRAYRPTRLVAVFGCGGARSRLRRFGMGSVCARLADFCIITEDNSRGEPVEHILADIRAGLRLGNPATPFAEIPDRRQAIYYALDHAQPGDIIAILGKGHETTIERGGIKEPFVEREIVELTEACAAALLKKAPEFDVILTAEAKGIPLAYEMARQSGKYWIPARKGPKLYMREPVIIEDQSITTAGKQTLVIDKKDIEYMDGKRILIVDDVISTGGSLHALETLAAKSTGTVVGCCAALAEGDAAKRTDIFFLEPLPLFLH